MRRTSGTGLRPRPGGGRAIRVCLGLAVVLAIALPAVPARPDVRGTWNGSFSGDGSTEDVVLEITSQRKTHWSGTFSMFDGDLSIAVSGKLVGRKVSAKFQGDAGKFQVTGGTMTGKAAADGQSTSGTFRVAVEEEGTFTGTWTAQRL